MPTDARTRLLALAERLEQPHGPGFFADRDAAAKAIRVLIGEHIMDEDGWCSCPNWRKCDVPDRAAEGLSDAE